MRRLIGLENPNPFIDEVANTRPITTIFVIIQDIMKQMSKKGLGVAKVSPKERERNKKMQRNCESSISDESINKKTSLNPNAEEYGHVDILLTIVSFTSKGPCWNHHRHHSIFIQHGMHGPSWSSFLTISSSKTASFDFIGLPLSRCLHPC
jgi:hypothetical protein